MDGLIETIAQIRGLSEEENPLKQKYKNHFEMIDSLNSFLQKNAKRTTERTDITALSMTDAQMEQMEKSFTRLGMWREKKPSSNTYDAALLMGAAEGGVRPRVQQLAEMLSNSDIKIKNIVILGCERKLWPLKKSGENLSFPEPILYKMLAEQISKREKKTVTAEEIQQKVLSIPVKGTKVDELSEEISAHPYFKDIRWPTETDLIEAVVKENPAFANQKLIVVHTPNMQIKQADGTVKTQRADTGKTVYEANRRHPSIFQNNAKILAISSQPYTRNQMTNIELNLPLDAEVDVIGKGLEDSAVSKEDKMRQFTLSADSFARTVYAVREDIRQRDYSKVHVSLLQAGLLGRK